MIKVAILLSTYNGQDYIEKQIQSIYMQSYKGFHLYIRDDGSSEEFVSQLRVLKSQYDFTLLEGNNVGFAGSFMKLLAGVKDADLYAFADQDDIWLPDKLQTAVEWFEKQNVQDMQSKPLLFHSAYHIIDKENKVVGRFYFSNKGYDFRRSITENHYSGFSMVINSKLREYMLKGNAEKIGYHDWWAAMIAQAFGVGHSDKKVTALHRTHGDNATIFNFQTRWLWLKKSLTEESEMHKRAVEFENCFSKELTAANRKILALFTMKRYNLHIALKKCFYPKRWRPVLSSEIVMRMLMLVGKI